MHYFLSYLLYRVLLKMLALYGYQKFLKHLVQGPSKLPEKFLAKYGRGLDLKEALVQRVDLICDFFKDSSDPS
jgi:hypothetical protein